MKILISILVLLSLLINVVSAEEFTLRKTRWGMTREQVISSEKELSPIINTEDEVSYETTIADIKFILYYRFKDGKLVQAAYNTVNNYTNPYKHIEEYVFLQGVLIGKYGKPLSEVAEVPEKYKKSEKNLGFAAVNGYMKLSSKWETPSTYIGLDLKSFKKEKLSNSIIYFSKSEFGLSPKE